MRDTVLTSVSHSNHYTMMFLLTSTRAATRTMPGNRPDIHVPFDVSYADTIVPDRSPPADILQQHSCDGMMMIIQ